MKEELLREAAYGNAEIIDRVIQAAYEKGLQDGYSDCGDDYDAGYADGHSAGYEDAENDNWEAGYKVGYDDAREAFYSTQQPDLTHFDYNRVSDVVEEVNGGYPYDWE